MNEVCHLTTQSQVYQQMPTWCHQSFTRNLDMNTEVLLGDKIQLPTQQNISLVWMIPSGVTSVIKGGHNQ